MKIRLLKLLLLFYLAVGGVPEIRIETAAVDNSPHVTARTIGISLVQKVEAQAKYNFRAQTSQELFNNTVFAILDIGQSNSMGRSTSARLVTILGESSSPTDVYVYYKPDYTTADNGNFEQLVEGSANTREPDNGTTGISGAYGMVARRIADVSPNKVYVIAMGDGGTALKQNLTTPDWYEGSVGECFEIATERYYKVAYPKIVAANPGKTIRTIICWHQGESDAADADGISGYATRFSSFITALRAKHYSLANAPLIITKLYYNINAGETSINSDLQSYANAHSSNTFINDISAYHRKIDLTVPEKGGITTAGADDQHTSYLGMQSKAVQTYTYIAAYFGF